jgi:hypothetical protein
MAKNILEMSVLATGQDLSPNAMLYGHAARTYMGLFRWDNKHRYLPAATSGMPSARDDDLTRKGNAFSLVLTGSHCGVVCRSHQLAGT